MFNPTEALCPSLHKQSQPQRCWGFLLHPAETSPCKGFAVPQEIKTLSSAPAEQILLLEQQSAFLQCMDAAEVGGEMLGILTGSDPAAETGVVVQILCLRWETQSHKDGRSMRRGCPAAISHFGSPKQSEFGWAGTRWQIPA